MFVGGLKLRSVGVIFSIGAEVASNILYTMNKLLNPTLANNRVNKRSPVAVYGAFFGTPAILQYQDGGGDEDVEMRSSMEMIMVNSVTGVNFDCRCEEGSYNAFILSFEHFGKLF